VFVMNRDGSHRHRLTHDPQTAPDGAGNRELVYSDSAPDFSPDGHWILFQRQPGYCPAGEGDIYVMRADGHRPHAITHTTGAACGDYAAAGFSPSGCRIAAVGSEGVVVMRVDGARRRVLTHTRNAYGAPNWRHRPASA
jgi:Tol biopolymer transport system component